MMKKIFVPLLLCLILLSSGCTRKKGPDSFDGVLERLSRAHGFDRVRECYTAGTIDAVGDAVFDGVVPEKEKLRILPLFSEKTRWDALSKKSDGDRGVMKIRYTDHPVENMIGFELELRFRKEKGSWKIDLEEELRQALRDRRGGSTAEYINRVKKRY